MIVAAASFIRFAPLSVHSGIDAALPGGQPAAALKTGALPRD